MEMSNNIKCLDNLLAIYNLRSIVHFPTRIVDNSKSMIDNIFIDASRNYVIEPCINGLSDHDAQLLFISNVFLPVINRYPYYIQIINKDAIVEFQLQLSWESWEDVVSSTDVSLMFNNFLNNYLRYYHSSFTKKERKPQVRTNQWLTKGIRISCNRKKELFLLCRLINNFSLKMYYKKYYKILSKFVLAAKRMHFNKIIQNSENKV